MVTSRTKRCKENILRKWRAYCGRQARNRRVLAKQAAKRLFGDLRSTFREWHEVVTWNLNIVRERKQQLRRIWKLKRKRFQFLALHIWRLGVQQNCRECGTKLRGKFVPAQVALSQLQKSSKVDDIDWSSREKNWDSKLPPGHRTGGGFFGKADSLAAIRPPLKRMKMYVPQGGTSSVRMLKQIIEKAGQVKEMTERARVELEASNIVMNTFISTFGVDVDDVSTGADSVPESVRGEDDDDFLEVDEKGKLGSDGLLNDSAILESYEKKTLLRYEESNKTAVTVDVRHGRTHSKEVAKRKEVSRKKKHDKQRLAEKQKRDVQKHVRFPKVQKD